MDPRLREDDRSNVIPVPHASFLRRQESIPETQSALSSTQKMDPRLREEDGKSEDDGNCGDVCKRTNGGKRLDKSTN